MRIDVILESNNSADEICALGRLAEECGLGAVWVSSMLDARDPFVNFSVLARSTENIRMGPIAVSPFELHPLKMANSLLTLNEFSGGRANIVVGGGGGTLDAMGLAAPRRVRALRECVEILKLASTGKPVMYEGEIYQVKRYNPRWAKAAPPHIYVGANKEQLLKMAPRYADGIMFSDFHLPQLEEAFAVIDAALAKAGRAKSEFRVNNFWAWHVKKDKDAAVREARQWLCLRGMLTRDTTRYFMNEADCEIVEANMGAFFEALRKRTHEIEGVPERIIDLLVENLCSTASVNDIDGEINRLKQFQKAGLNEIALRIYEDPADTIRFIGEAVVPALRN